jgi:hypothetical protein
MTSVRARSSSVRLLSAACTVMVAATVLAACSMHPLPEDVSRKNTFDIVEKIRCEAAEGLAGVPRDHPILRNTYIGYDFIFNIEESNNLGTSSATTASRGNVKLARESAIPKGPLSVEATPFAERKRQNVRTFRIIESLLELNNANCGTTTRANWVYPIAGAIGVQEIVGTYVGLERLTTPDQMKVAIPEGLTPQTPQTWTTQVPLKAKAVPIVFSDVLTFSTQLGIGLNPTLKLDAVVGSLKLTNLSILADNTRKDLHIVTVAIARDAAGAGGVDLPQGSRARKIFEDDEAYVTRLMNSSTYNRQLSRVANAVAKKNLTADTLVLLELERRRDQVEEEALANRLADLLKPPP